ncbi:uncharacterized protein LOC132688276 [Panthera onca]
MPPPPAGTARARPRRRVPGPPPAPRPPGRARLPRGNFGGTVARGRRGGGGERLPALPSLLPPRSPGALPGRSPPARRPRPGRPRPRLGLRLPLPPLRPRPAPRRRAPPASRLPSPAPLRSPPTSLPPLGSGLGPPDTPPAPSSAPRPLPATARRLPGPWRAGGRGEQAPRTLALGPRRVSQTLPRPRARARPAGGSTSGQPSAVNVAKDGGYHLCTFTECCLRLRSSWILCGVALSATEVFVIVLISQVLHCPHALPFSHHLILPYTSPKMPCVEPLHMQHGLSRTSFASLRDASSSLKIQKSHVKEHDSAP